MTTTDVLVVGAGPTGLTVANLLARAGVDFRLIDAKTGPVEESRAIVMHAKTLELLDKIGLAEPALADGQRIGSFALYREGRPAADLAFFEAGDDDRTPYPFALIFEQSLTERLLLHGLTEAGGRVEWETTLGALDATPGGVQATIRRPNGGQETIEARWLVGADGAHSAVRHALGLGFAGGTYKQVLFLADVALEGPIEAGRGTVELVPEGLLAYFPMPGDRRFRLLGNLPPDLAGREAITAGEVQEILDRSSRLGIRLTDTRWTSVYRTHHRMTERFRVGRVFLAGDAAHIHSPAGGQGMNTGIGDAYNLGWKLALVAKGQAREELLDSYEAERMPFARAILAGSDRGFQLADTTDPLTQRLKLLGLPLLIGLLSRPPALRRRAFWLLSQLWTSYRNSPAVSEAGPVGRLPRAGDRAPYGRFDAGPDAGRGIFALLSGTDHHLLLFAGLRPDDGRTEAAEGAIAAVLDRVAAPVRLHRIAAEQRRLQELYGADVATVVLVRPDGHIAYRGDAVDVVGLKRYLDGAFGERRAAAVIPALTRAEAMAAEPTPETLAVG